MTEEDVKQAYLAKARTAHPDQGGSVEKFKELQEAFEQATEYARFKAGRMQWLSRWVEQYAEQEQLIEEIKTLGGTVDVKSSDPLTRSIGPDFAVVLDKVEGIRLSGAKIDDHTVLRLVELRRMLAGLRKLALVDTSITDAGLLQLRGAGKPARVGPERHKGGPDGARSCAARAAAIGDAGPGSHRHQLARAMKLRVKHRNLTIT